MHNDTGNIMTSHYYFLSCSTAIKIVVLNGFESIASVS